MKKHLSRILIGLVFFIGLSVMLYPTASDWWNKLNQSMAILQYDQAVGRYSQDDYDRMFEQADAYNAKLAQTPDAFHEPELLEGYRDILDITDTGVMGYVTVPKINVELPIYHGLDEGILQVAVGHMEGTSFPVGGPSTHAVLSGHRGLPSAKLFTDLDQMTIGDKFNIKVLNELLTYQVDQIVTVLPEETDELQIVPGADYCTLITCTPYGINSHRLLVRGIRVPNDPADVAAAQQPYSISPWLIAPAVVLPAIIVVLAVLLVKFRRRKKA